MTQVLVFDWNHRRYSRSLSNIPDDIVKLWEDVIFHHDISTSIVRMGKCSSTFCFLNVHFLPGLNELCALVSLFSCTRRSVSEMRRSIAMALGCILLKHVSSKLCNTADVYKGTSHSFITNLLFDALFISCAHGCSMIDTDIKKNVLISLMAILLLLKMWGAVHLFLQISVSINVFGFFLRIKEWSG